MTEIKFTWVETHKELTQFLSTKKNSQKELIDLLKSVGITPFNDKEKLGDHDIELNEIDPFTFFCYIYKYGPERRLKYLQKIAETLKLSIPNDDLGIPSANAQRVWLFPYKFERVNNEIDRLWNFFKKAISNNITDDDFADVLSIRNVAKAKITEALFNINPEKYFPINGPSKPYIKNVLGIEPVFETYSDYIALLEKIKNKISIPFYELSYEAWKWNDSQGKVNYWVFQGNPKVFDFETALKQEILSDWTVSAHKDKIKIGDKIILWITGNEAGCYALAEITSEPHLKTTSPDDHLWKGEDKSVLKAGIKIIHNLVDNPILKEEIQNIEDLKDLKIGNQGTNFSASEDEYSTLLELINSRGSSFEKLISQLNKSDFNNYIQFLREILNKFKLKQGDERIVFSTRDNNLNFLIGQRYCWNLFVADKKGKFGVISIDKLKENSGRFDGTDPAPYYTHFDEINSLYENIKSIDTSLELELKRTKKSSFRKFNNTEFENYVFEKTPQPINNNSMKLSLNTILYGPPGTGKTYKLKEEYFSYFTDNISTQTSEEFYLEIIEKYTWWQIIGAVLIDLKNASLTEIYNHKLITVKKSQVDNKDPNATIRGLLQSHTIDNCEFVNLKERTYPQFIYKDEAAKWSINEISAKNEAPEIYELYEKITSFQPHNTIKKRYVFTTFHQSFSYEDFIEGIKPIVHEDEQNPEKGKQVIYDIKPGLFKQIVKEANNDRANNYAIFIDEINRGNIANIFGELITLIEEDKRIDTVNYIPVKLPYSGEPFGVPPNLFIIGTMNTADRSVEALDTALRRRFSFIEMNPEPQKLSEPKFKCEGIDLEKLLFSINGRIEKLLDKDYCIGHSYFMNIQDRKNPIYELRVIFQNKILPLLQEYFYGDWGKIMLVIGKEFVFKKTETVKFLTSELTDEYEEYNDKPIYGFTDSQKWTLNSFKSIYE
jgi:hypothetical protein